MDGYRYWNGCRGIWRTYGELGTPPESGTGKLEKLESWKVRSKVRGTRVTSHDPEFRPHTGRRLGVEGARREHGKRADLSWTKRFSSEKTLGVVLSITLLQIGGSTIDCPGRGDDSIMNGLYVSPCLIERSEIARPWCAHPDPARSVEDHAHRGTADPQVPGGCLSGRTHLVAGVRDLCSIEEKTGETMAPAARCESSGR